MIVTENGYSIEEYPAQNKIVISLPQRPDNITSTYVPISNRKSKLSEDELAIILQIAISLYQKTE